MKLPYGVYDQSGKYSFRTLHRVDLVETRYLAQGDGESAAFCTLNDYWNTFNKFRKFLDADLPLGDITKNHIQEFLASYKHLSDKTIRNYHTGLSSLWTWAKEEGLVEEHVVRQVIPPKPTEPDINPFTETDVKLMLYACKRSRSYTRSFHPEKISHTLSNCKRNEAIILTLLDTGVRAGELCNIKMRDVDLRNKQITVHGKGKKKRAVEISSRTSQVIWRYLTTRPALPDHAPLFTGQSELSLSEWIVTICKKDR